MTPEEFEALSVSEKEDAIRAIFKTSQSREEIERRLVEECGSSLDPSGLEVVACQHPAARHYEMKVRGGVIMPSGDVARYLGLAWLGAAPKEMPGKYVGPLWPKTPLYVW